MDRIITTVSKTIQVQHTYHAKANSKGGYLIYLRFYILEKDTRQAEFVFSTGISTPADKWDDGTIKGTDVHTQIKNERLREILTIVRDGLHDLKKLKLTNPATVKKEIETAIKPQIVKNVTTTKEEKEKYLSKITQHSLMAIKDSFISTIPDRSITYKKNFRLAVQKFNQWWQLTNKNTPLPTVNEITTTDIKQFKAWLAKKANITHNTVTTYCNRLRTLFLYAKDEKLINESPIPRKGLIEGYVKGKQAALTVDELQRLNDLNDLELTATQRKVKYLFLFLCSTGMGLGEFRNLTKEHFQQVENDILISKNRNKTGVEFSILMSEKAKAIYTNELAKIERINSDVYIKRMLKVLTAKVGITKNVTPYVGRKTFATQWANDGNNIYYLQQILGHTNIQTTMKYVNFSQKDLINASREAYSKNAFHAN